MSTRPISEKYEVKSDGCICLQEMIFDHDGPGLPSYPEENTSWMLDSGMVRVAGYRSCWNRLNLGISSSGLELRTARGRIDLVKRIGPDRLISLSVEQLPSFVMLSCSFSGFGSDGQI